MRNHEQAAPPRFLDEMSTIEIRDYLTEMPGLLVPLGTTEPHGEHLPVGTDSLCPIGLCEWLSSQTGLVIAPPLRYGYLDRMIGHPGAVTLSRETYRTVVQEVLEQFAQMGVRFFVVANGHGPNQGPILEAVRVVVERYRAQFLVLEWYFFAGDLLEPLLGTSDIGHGGVVEVAAVQRYRPELVHLERATQDTFVLSALGVTTFPYQRTAVTDDPAAVLELDPSKMAQFMAAVEDQALAHVQEALARFRHS